MKHEKFTLFMSIFTVAKLKCKADMPGVCDLDANADFGVIL